jgi:hypothetical protein
MDFLGGLDFNNIPQWLWTVIAIVIIIIFLRRKKKP